MMSVAIRQLDALSMTSSIKWIVLSCFGGVPASECWTPYELAAKGRIVLAQS
jgi:hypothetical protein